MSLVHDSQRNLPLTDSTCRCPEVFSKSFKTIQTLEMLFPSYFKG